MLKLTLFLIQFFERHQEIALTKEYFDNQMEILAKKASCTKDELIEKLKKNQMMEIYLNYMKNKRVIKYILEMTTFID